MRLAFYIHLFILFVLVSGFNAFMYFYTTPSEIFLIIPITLLFLFAIIALNYEREMKKIWKGNK